MDKQVLTVGQAIQHMRELTKQGIPFSFSFYSYSNKTGKSRGRIHVPKAFLRNQPNRIANVLLEYWDVSQQMHKRCYQCLIVEFNGIKTILK